MKQSEARLLGVFCILILGAVTYFVLEVIGGRKDEAIANQQARQNKILEYNALIRDKEQWEVKREFVQRYQPVYRTEEEEAPALETYFRRNAGAFGLEIKKLLPQPPEPLGDTMMAISLQAQVSGLGADVLQFLIQLQAENRFYAIPSITIEADRKDPTMLIVNMIFSRWFSLDGEPATPVEVPEMIAPNPTTIASEEPGTDPDPGADPADQPAVAPPGLIEDPSPDATDPEPEPVAPVAVQQDEAGGADEAKTN